MRNKLKYICSMLLCTSASLLCSAQQDDLNPFGSLEVSQLSHAGHRVSMADPNMNVVHFEILNTRIEDLPTTWQGLIEYLTSSKNFPGCLGDGYTVPFFVLKLRSIEERYLAQSSEATPQILLKIFDEQMSFIANRWGIFPTNGFSSLWAAPDGTWLPLRWTPIYQFIYERAHPTTEETKGCFDIIKSFFKCLV